MQCRLLVEKAHGNSPAVEFMLLQPDHQTDGGKIAAGTGSLVEYAKGIEASTQSVNAKGSDSSNISQLIEFSRHLLARKVVEGYLIGGRHAVGHLPYDRSPSYFENHAFTSFTLELSLARAI